MNILYTVFLLCLMIHTIAALNTLSKLIKENNKLTDRITRRFDEIKQTFENLPEVNLYDNMSHQDYENAIFKLTQHLEKKKELLSTLEHNSVVAVPSLTNVLLGLILIYLFFRIINEQRQ